MALKSSDITALKYSPNSNAAPVASSQWDSFYRDKSAALPLFTKPLYKSSDALITSASTYKNLAAIPSGFSATSSSLDILSKNNKAMEPMIPKGISTAEMPDGKGLVTKSSNQGIPKKVPGNGSKLGSGLTSMGIGMATDFAVNYLEKKEADKKLKEFEALNEVEKKKALELESSTNKQNLNSNMFQSMLAGARSKMEQANKTISAKQGTKIQLAKFIESGKEGSLNVIPSGTLHKDKNNIGDKGIPMIDVTGKKVMEIEKGELILRIEATKKLESLVKAYNEDPDEGILLHIGKLMSTELGLKTEDLTDEFSNIL